MPRLLEKIKRAVEAMMNRVPTKREALIMEQNGLEKNDYAVCQAGEDYLHLLCYRTRDDVILRRGDRPWPPEKKEETAP